MEIVKQTRLWVVYLRGVLLLVGLLTLGCSAPDEQTSTTAQGLCTETRLTVASATASSVEHSGKLASAAIDGSMSTRWSSAYSDPQWIKIDLGASRHVTRVVLKWENAASSDYEIQVSDNGTNWTPVYVDHSGNGGTDDVGNLSATARYVRMYSHHRTSQYGVSLWELEIYGHVDPSCDQPPPSTPPAGCAESQFSLSGATASSAENSAMPASKAIDDNFGTRWSSAYNDPQWIKIDLGATKHVSRITLHWETAASRRYDLQVSTDGNAWQTIYTDSNGNGGSDDISGLSGVGRYLRIYSHTRTTSYGVSLWEVKVHGDANPECAQPPAPAGCALDQLSTPSASASSVEHSSKTANKAIDGDLGTRWSSAYSDPQWLEIDLGASRHVGRVKLHWEAAASCHYDLQVSEDGNSWRTIYTDTNGDGGTDDITHLSGVGRYLRVYSHSRTTSYGVSLFEVKVYGDTNPQCASPAPEGCDQNQLTTPSVFASSMEDGGKPASKATDGNLGTRWSSEFCDPQWLVVDFGGRRHVSRVTLDWEAAASRHYDLELSDDAASWTTIYTDTNGNGGTDDITGLSGAGRFLRLFSHARTTSYGVSLWEIKVYGDQDADCAAPVGDPCANDSECQSGLTCVAGTCRDCATSACEGDPCSEATACVPGLICSGGTCHTSCDLNPSAPGCVAGHCANGVKDAGESDVDCGGDCPDCSTGDTCGSNTDCKPGSACGTHNGACLGGTRTENVCWPAQCQDGIDETECGQPDSPCGPNCACVEECDPSSPINTCSGNQVCKQGLQQLFDSAVSAAARAAASLDRILGVCVDPRCPSNDPALCGSDTSLCGKQCICVPDCSNATRDNPKDTCGGECPHLCPSGEACCTEDLHCAVGSTCQVNDAGVGVCRPGACAYRRLVPPLCGTPGALCGDQCPACAPTCDGRECGPDSTCGESCGSCGAGEFCNGAGQCAPTTPADPPIMVPDGSGGTKELEDLPTPTTSPVGALKGEFSVSDQGTAQYNVPIEVPPGRAGLEPGISLRYSGSRANGDTGVGWRIEGLSQITRCPRIHALDGYSAPVKGDTSDRFCIDGKRLETVAGGAYGGNGTEYRTLVDSFAKVVSYSEPDAGLQHTLFPGLTRTLRVLQGPDYFRVWLKDGRILTYGKTRDALVMGRNGVRHTWMLNRIEDRSGNTILIGYTSLVESRPWHLAAGVPNSVRPSVISYTGHGAEAGDREVRFNYESRADSQLTFYQGGMPTLVNERLKSVTTYVKNKPVRTYRLEYEANHASLIEKIFECAGDGGDPTLCKAPTTFDYVEESGFTQAFSSPEFLFGGQLDADGDGKPDFLTTRAHVDGVAANPKLQAAAIAADVAVAVASYALSPVGGIAVNVVWAIVKGPFWGLFAEDPKITYTRSLRFGPQQRGDVPRVETQVSGIPCNGSPSFFLDFDQDGKDDVASACPLGVIRIARSQGDGHFASFPTNAPIVALPTQLSYRGSNSVVPPPVLFDLNGDSLQDLISCKDHFVLQARLRLPPPQAGFAETPIEVVGDTLPIPGFPSQQLRVPYCSEGVPTYNIFDVDGDGAPELLAHHAPSVLGLAGQKGWYALRYSRSNLATHQLAWERIEFPNTGSSGSGENMLLADVNGDGLSDVWRAASGLASRGASGAEATLWLNTGKGRFLPQMLAHPRPSLDGDPRFTLRTTAAIDYDSDGQMDLVEHWKIGDGTEPQSTENTVLGFDWNLLELNHTHPVLIFRTPDGSSVYGGNVSRVGDVDGDGNPDIFSDSDLFYGSGLKNMLLSKVTDGLGKVINISYDDSGTYQRDCSEVQTWPEVCLKQMKGLVSRHQEGFTHSDAVEIERHFTYTYANARMNVTGHGWLGFDRRTAREEVAGERHQVLTEFWPVERFRPNATVPTSAVNAPYLYPLVGLPKKVTIDQTIVDASPLEDAAYNRRNVVQNTWKVQQSEDARPFPVMAAARTSTYSRQDLSAVTDDGTLRTECLVSSTLDGYGNVTVQGEVCQDEIDNPPVERTSVTTTFAPSRSEWLIGNAELVTRSSSRGGQSQTQVSDPEYDILGRLHAVTRDPAGDRQRSTYTRDAFGNIERIVEDVATGEAARTTTITYDEDGIFPATITNAKGHTTQLELEPDFGQVKKVADPNGVLVVHAYDALGLLRDTSDPSGLTTFTYEQFATVARVFTSAGFISPALQISIERQGLEDSHGGATVRELDPYGRLVRTRSDGFDGAQVFAEQSYDEKGRVVGTTAPHLAAASLIPGARYTYDGLDRLVRLDHFQSTVTPTTGTFLTVIASRHHQYASGVSLHPSFQHLIGAIDCPPDIRDTFCAVDVELTIDEEGKRNAVVKDHRGLIVRSVDGENIVSMDHASHYQYGAFNHLRSFRDNGNSFHSLVHDDYGRLLTHADADTGSTVNVYNGFGELERSTDPKGQVRNYAYDTLGRLETIDDPAGTTRWIYDQGVSALGQLTRSISPPTPENASGQQVHYTYEAATPDHHRALPDSMQYTIDGISYRVELTYDDLSRIDTIRYPSNGGGAPIRAKYEYDESSAALQAVSEIGSGTPRPIWQIDSAFQGHLIAQETFGNGATTTLGYDPDRRFLTSVRTTLSTETIQDLSYSHFKNGQIQDRITPSKTEEFTYDPLGRLASLITNAGTPTPYHYDTFGNITRRGATTTTYDPSRPHLVDQVGPNTYDYDLNGNVALRTGPDIPGGAQSILYTPFDLPSRVITGTGPSERLTTFDYTADATRVVRRDSGSSRHFVTDLYQRQLAADGSTLEERFRIFAGSRPVAEISRQASGDSTLYFHQDHLGTPQTLSSQAGESFQQEYDPFGAVVGGPSPSGGITRHGFTGHEQDDDLGLTDMGGRIYDPLAARFMSADPILQAPFFSQGLNRWSYVFNDPVNLTDPSGFAAGDPGMDPNVSQGIGAAAVLVHSFPVSGSIYVLAQNAGASLAVPALGGIGNIATTIAMNPFGGSSGGTATVAAPTSAPSTTGNRSTGNFAQANSRGQPGPAVQERPANLSLFAPERGALAQDAGTPSTGTEGASNSGDSATRDPGALGGDVVAAVLPVPTPQKAWAGLRFLNWLRKLLPGAKAARAAAKFDPSRAAHIFREAAGHVNPASAGSQARFARLFESVGSNPANLRTDAVQAGIITQDAANAGVQAFTQVAKSGEQIWVTVRSGLIQNAGVNPVGALR